MTRHDSRSRMPRSDLRSLLRSRVVQGLLVGTVVAQGAASYGGARLAGEGGEGVSLGMTAVAVQMPATVSKADSASALAEEYREKGYAVSVGLAEKIYHTALKHGIEPQVAFGLVRTESEFHSYATSRVGAIGLTQLMPGTARWFQRNITVAQLRDEDTNLEIGFRYLRELIDRYDGDLHLALTAYNRGTGTVDRVVERGEDPDNGYAGLVLKGSR